jgi:hypothetical protein
MAVATQEINQEDLRKRAQQHKAADELGRMKKEIAESSKSASSTSSFSANDEPLRDLTSIGQTDIQVYNDVCQDHKNFIQLIEDYALSLANKERYFPNNKVHRFIALMKKTGLELQARSAIDMFKSRVKERNGGQIPTKKEKKGIFGKLVERPFTPEELIREYDIEPNIPSSETAPLGAHGTQTGLLKYVAEVLLHNEDIGDPLKKAPRKTVARFLQASGLMSKSPSGDEKYFAACLVTPDSLLPKSKQDREQLKKYKAILKKGSKWLEDRIQLLNQTQSTD